MSADNESELGFDASQALETLAKMQSGFQSYNTALNSVISTSELYNQVGGEQDKVLQTLAKDAAAAASSFQNLAKSQKNIQSVAVVNPTPVSGIANSTNFQDVANQLGQANKQVQTFHLSLQSIARLAISRIVTRGIFEIITGLHSGVEEAQAFELQLARLQTIHPGGIDQFTQALIGLSAQFGQNLTAEAAGLFTILSSQIGTTSQALDTLGVASQFARATLVPLNTSVDLITTAIKEFGDTSANADQIAAELVQTMQLGKLPAEELAAGLGKVGQAAEALGVSRQEVEAFVATLSEAGVKPGEAFSLLNNILLKLAHPTNDLKNVFSQLGIASIELEIQTNGLQGTLQKLTQVSGTSAEAVGDLFDRVRTARGVLAITGQSANDFAANLQKIKSANDALLESASANIAKTPAARIEEDAKEAQAFLINDFGRSVLQTTADVIDAFGGVTNIIKDVTSTAEGLAIGFGVAGVVGALQAAIVAGSEATGTFSLLNLVLDANPVVLLGTAIAVVAAALIRFTSAGQSAAEVQGNLNKQIDAGAQAAKLQARVLAQEQATALQAHTKDLTKSFDEIQGLYNKDRIAAQAAQDTGGRTLKRSLEDRVNLLNDYARNLEQVQVRAAADIHKLLQDNTDLTNAASAASFERSLSGLTDPQKAQAEATRAVQLINAAKEAASKGNVQTANDLANQATELANSSASLSHNESIANNILQQRIQINNTLIDQRKKEAQAAALASQQTKAIADRVSEDVNQLNKLDLLQKGKDVSGPELADIEKKRQALAADIDQQVAKLPPVQIPLFLDTLSLNKQLLEIKRGVESGGKFVTVTAAVEFQDKRILEILTQHTAKIPITFVATIESTSGQKFDPFAGPSKNAQSAAQNLSDVQKQIQNQTEIPQLQASVTKNLNGIQLQFASFVDDLINKENELHQVPIESSALEGIARVLQGLGVIQNTFTSATPEEVEKFKQDFLELAAAKKQIELALSTGNAGDIQAAQQGLQNLAKAHPDFASQIQELTNQFNQALLDQAKLNVDLQVQANIQPALSAIQGIQSQVQPIVVPVQVQEQHAKGGIVSGPDVQIIGRTPGEFITNPLATQMFRPQLEAMNRFANGGMVQNFGDINVSVSTKDASQISGDALARQIQRAMRKKTVRSF